MKLRNKVLFWNVVFWISLSILLYSCHSRADLCLGIDVSSAKFAGASDSANSMVRKLHSEHVRTTQDARSDAISADPVLGWKFNDAFAVEISTRTYIWDSHVHAHEDQATLISSATGAKIPVTNLDFSAHAWTTARLVILSGVYTPSVSEHGKLYLRAGIVQAHVRSRVYEHSTEGSGTLRAQSSNGSEAQYFTDSFAIGYQYTIGHAVLVGYVEQIGRIGNGRIVFVDNGGVGTYSVPAVGIKTMYNF